MTVSARLALCAAPLAARGRPRARRQRRGGRGVGQSGAGAAGVARGTHARRARCRAYTLFGGEDNETLVAPGGLQNVRTGFTAANELFVGRAAMFGHASALYWDKVNGEGVLHRLSGALGLDLTAGSEVLVSFVALSLAFGLLPRFEYNQDSGDWGWSWDASAPVTQASRQSDKRNSGDGIVSGVVTSYQLYVGSLVGLTVNNERFLCRCAMFSFNSMLLVELATGLGPLGQLSAETGLDLQRLPCWAVVAALSATLIVVKGVYDAATEPQSRFE